LPFAVSYLDGIDQYACGTGGLKMTELENRDKAELKIDGHVRQVLAFMQSNIPVHKLVGIAERLPELARLLWDHYPQEPVIPISMRGTPLIATESDLGRPDVGGGSVAEECALGR
jgi:hypothetical protein